MSQDTGLQSHAYAVLFVDPTAPAELLASMYWSLAGDLQKRRSAGEHIDDELHHLTRAYECVADAESRAAYDASFGFDKQPLTVRQLPPVRRSLRGRLLRRPAQRPIDFYEVMGVAPDVSADLLPAAYRTMRDLYLRLRGARQRQLLDTLDKAYATLTSPDARDRYDGRAPSKPDAFVEPAPAASKKPRKAGPSAPESGDKAPSTGAKAAKLAGRGAWFTLKTLAAAILLAIKGLSSLTAKAYARWRKPPAPRVPRPAPIQQPLPPLPNTQRDRPRREPAELEDRFLGRVATSVQESESHLQAADSDPGSAKSI